MTDVHPTLEAVARAMVKANGRYILWEAALPEARAALNALADTFKGGYFETLLREIAAEPKPTVEDVLREHLWRGIACTCGHEPISAHTDHQADMLRKAGLLKEDA